MPRWRLFERPGGQSKGPSPTPSRIAPDEPILPLELVEHIVALALDECEADEQRLCTMAPHDPRFDELYEVFVTRTELLAKLVLVNRHFNHLYTVRRRIRPGSLPGVLKVDDVDDLRELVRRAKADTALRSGLRGMEVDDPAVYGGRGGADGLYRPSRALTSKEAVKESVKDWKELRKRCRQLEYVQLGDFQDDVRALQWVSRDVVHALEGVTTLRLLDVQIAPSRRPSTFTLRRWMNPPYFPKSVRHLALIGVELLDDPHCSRRQPGPPPLGSNLISLSLVDVCIRTRPCAKLGTKVFLGLAEQNSPHLKALHFSRQRQQSPLDVLSIPAVLNSLVLPSIRLLSISILHFTPSLLQPPSAAHLKHLALTACDIPFETCTISSRVERAYEELRQALAGEQATRGHLDGGEGRNPRSAPAGLPHLKRLDLPVHPSDGSVALPTQALPGIMAKQRELVEVADKRGIEVRFVNLGKGAAEAAFAATVREMEL
ncbi:hypothetical protein JCM6882_004054 [Rhodosporidiobolus microsporus]